MKENKIMDAHNSGYIQGIQDYLEGTFAALRYEGKGNDCTSLLVHANRMSVVKAQGQFCINILEMKVFFKRTEKPATPPGPGVRSQGLNTKPDRIV